MQQRPPLSVVFTTKEPWPRAAICLNSLSEQARAAGAEVVFVDGSPSGIPEKVHQAHPHVTFLRTAGANNFQMRAQGVLHASGEIVAITEDHCRLAPDWCQRILDAHRQWPEAAAISGNTLNGAEKTVTDWAHYMFAHGNAMPPAPTGPTTIPSLQANISYKRRVVPTQLPEWGYMDWLLRDQILARGETIVRDERIRVWHVQPMSLAETCTLQFHDGRAVSGFRRREIGVSERVLRVAVALSAMAPLLVFRTAQWTFTKAPARYAASIPLLVLFATCRSWGAALGLAFGEGRSPWDVD